MATTQCRRFAAAKSYSTTTRVLAVRPKVSGMYISSAFVGAPTKVPGVVAHVRYS